MAGTFLPLVLHVIQKSSDSLFNKLFAAGDRVLFFESLRTGAEPINSVDDLVNYVVNKCIAEEKQVGSLHISGHGNANGFRIGNKDFIDNQSLPRHKDNLRKLAPHFMLGASVYIDACEAGQNPTLLREFSKVLGGVKVVGYQKEQGPWGGSGPSTVEQAD